MPGIQDKPHGAADTWFSFWRRQAGVTTAMLSGDPSVGLSKVFLSQLEHGRKGPSPQTADKLARALSKRVDVELTASDLFPTNGMKTPNEATRLYFELVKKRQRQEGGDTEVVSEEEVERDMAWLDSREGRAARDRYYERQDPASYEPWELELPDGRIVKEQPPKWFRTEMRASQHHGSRGGKRSERRPARRSRTGGRSRSSRGSPDDDSGPEGKPASGRQLGRSKS